MIHFYKHTLPSLLILSCLLILLAGCSPSDEVLSAAQDKYAELVEIHNEVVEAHREVEDDSYDEALSILQDDLNTIQSYNLKDMSEEEIKERMEALSYLKIHPRDKEENKLLLLRGERLYEESIGMERMQIEYALREFEKALDTREDDVIEGARRDFKDFLENFSE